MTSIKLAAPAKVNLFLKVLNKRRDSYHNIITVFERISLADDILIEKAPNGISVSTDRLITARPEDNIAYKAARALLDRKRGARGVRIHIKKRIPIAAGLGGGSSDAASVLLGIDRLFDMRIGRKGLIGIARKIGADVPFFVLETAFAVGKGIGDKLNIIKSNARFWHLIVNPGFRVNTKDIYDYYDKRPKGLALRQNSGSSGERLPNHLTKKMGDVKIHPSLYNDLETALTAKKPVIGNIIRRLADILDNNVAVSGSGPSLFCLYETRKEALEARNKLYRGIPARERKRWQIFIVRTKT